MTKETFKSIVMNVRPTHSEGDVAHNASWVAEIAEHDPELARLLIAEYAAHDAIYAYLAARREGK